MLFVKYVTITAVKILFQTFHKSTFNVFVCLVTNIIKLIANCNGNTKKAYGQAQLIAAAPGQPISTAGKLNPV